MLWVSLDVRDFADVSQLRDNGHKIINFLRHFNGPLRPALTLARITVKLSLNTRLQPLLGSVLIRFF
jgi:hypothetical protein